MNRRTLLQAALALGLLAVAAGLLLRTLRRPAPGEQAFFYDLSARRIFTAARTAVPPIRGVDGPDEDAFRATVVSTNGRPADRRGWRVAYLEKCSPELKRQMEAAQAVGEALPMGRAAAQTHRFVRRLDGPIWYALDSPEAEAILNDWARPGPNGRAPVLCSP